LFNNNREQGLVLTIHKDDKDFIVWACECRNSDNIMVVLGNDKNINSNNMFDDEAYSKAKYFKCDDYDSAVDHVYKQIKYLFKDDLNYERHFKFDTYKSMEDLRRIELDASDLDYEDYYELASFFDEDEQYSCDMIILNGKIGYRYNKHGYGNIDHLTFEETKPNLENEVTLMLDMQEKLNKFINEELVYDIEMNHNDIKI